MGYHAKLSAAGLNERDVAQLANDGLVPDTNVSVPISGCVLHDGQTIPFTLDTDSFAQDAPSVLPEHIAIAVLLVASLIAAFWHVFS